MTVEQDGFNLLGIAEGQGHQVLVVGSAVYYPRTFSAALRRYCRLGFVDLRHFARHDAPVDPATITLEKYCEDIEALRQGLGFERFVLLGHSHHGNLAMEYTLRHPGNVTRLVLVGSPPCDVSATLQAGEQYWQAQASPERKRLLAQRRSALDENALAALPMEQAFVARYVNDAPLYWNDPDYDGSWLWDGVPVSTIALSGFKTFFVDYDFARTAARLEMPVLVCMGRQDFIVPHSLWDDCQPPFRQFDYHLFDSSGHTPQLEEADLFNQRLLAWLAGQ